MSTSAIPYRHRYSVKTKIKDVRPLLAYCASMVCAQRTTKRKEKGWTQRSFKAVHKPNARSRDVFCPDCNSALIWEAMKHGEIKPV